MAYHDDRSHRNYYRREDSNRYHRCPEYPDRDGPGTRHQSGEYWAPTHREHRDIGNNTWYVDYRAQGACASVSYRRKSLLERIEPENRQKWLSLRERITVSSGIPLAQRISTMKVEEPLGNEPELDYSRVHEREETPLPETEPEGDSSSVIEVIDLTMESDTEKEDEESSTMDAPEFEEGEVVEVTSQREVCEIHDEEETVREGRQHQAERNLGAVPGNVDSDPEPWQPSDSLVPLFLVRSEDISSDGPSLATVDDPQSPPPIGVAEMNGPPPLSLSESVTDDVDMNLPETDAHAQNRTYDERREVGEVEQPTSEAEAQMSHDDEDVGDSSPPDENLVVAEPSTTRSPAEQSVGESNPPDKNLVVVEPSTTCSTEKRTSPLVPPLVEAFLDNHIDATAAIGQGPQSPEQNVVLDSNISQLQIIADNPARSTDHLMSHQPTQETEGSLSAALQATRKEMLSLVVRNALFQNPNATFHPEYVEKTLLSDERCLDFMKQSKIVVQQLENRQRQLDVEELRDMSSVDVSSGTKRPLEEVGNVEGLRQRKRTNQSDNSEATLVGNVAAMDVDAALDPHHSPATWVQAHVGRNDFYDPNLPSPNVPSSVSLLLNKAKHVLNTPPIGSMSSIAVSFSPSPMSQSGFHLGAEPRPSYQVPGLWFVKIGTPHSDILECHFDVSPEVAAATCRWARRDETFDADATHVCVRLLCLPRDLVEEIFQRMPGDHASPEDMTKLMAHIPTTWPQRGSLIVDLNVGQPSEQTWFAEFMRQDSPPLDVTSSVEPGLNHLRIIQLANMSDRLFVLHVAPPPEEKLEAARLEEQRRNLARKAADERNFSTCSPGISFNIQVKHAVFTT